MYSSPPDSPWFALPCAIGLLISNAGAEPGPSLSLIFGRNAITAYVIAWLFAVLLYVFNTRLNGTMVNGQDYIFQRFFAPLGSPSFTSLLFSLAFVLLCLLPIWLMDRKKIFLKI
ncbi:MAG: hypothetical protein WB799_10675 [Candidatus Sulfotelmatobacter sp.]